ncbi:hypothetical protein UQW22_14460 [Isoptericola halotolerans]|uniref:hypothetical protein n=1 Tax=Isoptericola halotolerans TaxID=300560 RepID=UPI00388DB766
MGRATARQMRAAGTTASLVGAVLVLSSSGGDATASFAEPMAAHATGGDVAFRPDAISATLPSVRYDDGASATTFSDLAVVGRLTDWQPGRATDWSTDAGRQLDFAHPADTRTVVLSLQVAEVLAADGDEVAAGDQVEVVAVLPGDADAEAAGEALTALDDVVVLASRGPAEHSGEWWVGLGGVLLGDLDDGGGLTWPVLEAAGSDLAPVTDDAGRLAALRAAAQRAPRTVTVP